MKNMLCFTIPVTLVIFAIILPLPKKKNTASAVALPSPEPSPGSASSKQHFLMRTNRQSLRQKERGRHGGIKVGADDVRQYARAMTQTGEVAQLMNKYKAGSRSPSTSPSNLRQGRT
uniref:Uncharacterized protein n=1 Tax=Rhipicephalus appendiculatus TaxID=34631 RepID=A0A131YBJ5_RHIAP